MTKISRFPVDYKVSEGIFHYLTNEEYCSFRHSGLITKKLHTFRLVLNYREIQVECPVIILNKRPVAVIFPAFKISYRPYPIFVYLFAVALCLTRLSMRKSAMLTGKKFGILNFSHSTISRAFSRMSLNYTLLETLVPTNNLNTDSHTSLPGKPKCIVSSLYSEVKKKAAPFIFNALSPILDITFKESLIVYEHFMKYCCLMI